jgi:hypothetical protein
MQDTFDRRVFIGGAGALAVAGIEGIAPAFGAAVSDIVVKVALAQGEHVFHSATGKDLGNYTGPNFVQRNIVVRDRSIPFTVFFRPDVTSDRLEVVFEWGDPFRSDPTNLDAYTVDISVDGKTVATVDVPEHFWLSRWRWQSAPRQFVKTPEDLFAAKVFPRFKKLTAAPAYSIMDFSNIVVYMPTTGERFDIGVVPEYYAAYLATGDDAMKASMLAWAESAGSYIWHMRDPKTWGPLNWHTYPKATTYYDQAQSSPKLSLYTKPPAKSRRGKVVVDSAHEPALAFVPFMLTGDLYYLEELQFMATYFLNSSPSWRGIFDKAQTRAWAWSLRTMADVVYATPEKVTGSLLPESYWQYYLDQNLKDVLREHVYATDFKNKIFASGTDDRRIPFWQEDYLATVLGVVVYRGFSAWRPVFEWKLRSDIARTNGTSGWPRSTPTLYFPKPGPSSVSQGKNQGDGEVTVKSFDFSVEQGRWSVKFLDPHTYTVTRPSGKIDGRGKVGGAYVDNDQNALTFTVRDGSTPFAAGDSFVISVSVAKTWSELAAANDIEPSADDTLRDDLTSDYPQTVRAALVMGAKNGVEEAKRCLDWLDPQVHAKYRIGWRWSIDRDT